MSRTAEEYIDLFSADEHDGPIFHGDPEAVKRAGGHARVSADFRQLMVDDGALGPDITKVIKVLSANMKHAKNGATPEQNGKTDNVIPTEKLAAKRKAQTEPDVEDRRRKTADQETAQSTAKVISTYGEPDLKFDDDDIGNMDRYVARYGGQDEKSPRQLIWTKSQGWLHHDAKQGRWMQGDEYASQAAVQVVRSIKEAAIDPRVPVQRQNLLFKWGRTSATGAHVPIMIQRASQHEAFVTNELLLDRDPMLLNCPNGTLDLRTGKLLSHDPANLITRVTAIEYDPDAQSDMWDSVIEQATRGVPDLADFLRRAAGYTLTGSTKEDAIFILHGAGGTAKSSITQALEASMGMYAKAMSADALTTPGNSGHSEGIAVLAGARMAITGEADKTDKMREGLFKRLSGGDTINASRKNRPSFDFKVQFKLWIVTNHVPKLSPDDSGIWRRVIKMPFENVILKPDRNIRTALQSEPKHMRAVLAWAARGAIEWRDQGLNSPDSIIKATEELRLSMDGLGDFFKRYVYINPAPKAHLYTASKDLIDCYVQYAKDSGIPERFHASSKTMAAGLRFRGCTPHSLNGHRDRGWLGIVIKEEPDPE